MKCSLGASNFLEEISSLSHSVVFLYFFALIALKAFLSFLAILWNSAFKWEYLSLFPLLFASLHFTAICKASSDNHFAFLHFFSMGRRLLRVPWTARRSNQSILKEISPGCSLEALMLKLKLQYFGHLIKEVTHWKRP